MKVFFVTEIWRLLSREKSCESREFDHKTNQIVNIGDWSFVGDNFKVILRNQLTRKCEKDPQTQYKMSKMVLKIDEKSSKPC